MPALIAVAADRVARLLLLHQHGGQADAQLLLARLRRCAQETIEESMPVAGKIGALSILLKNEKLMAGAIAILKKSPLTDHSTRDISWISVTR